MLLPIYVMYDSKMDKTEIRAIEDAIDIAEEMFSERIIVNYETGSRAFSEFSSADWYLRNAGRKVLGRRTGVMAEDILQLFNREPLQEVFPHFTVLLTSKTLILNDVRVTDAVEGMAAVVSLASYKKASTHDRYNAVRAKVLHGIGHVIGIPDPDRGEVNFALSDDGFIIGCHCQDVNCIMHDEEDPIGWIRFANKIEQRDSKKIFCNNCLNDIEQLDL